jgi:hypothetical protein
MFSASVLDCLERDLGVALTDHFDLVVGTSAGGIIALALGAGLRPQAVVDFYGLFGPSIFRYARGRSALHLVRAKYGRRHLSDGLVSVFGTRKLWESSVPLCIPSYDLRSDSVYLFRTPHSARLARDWRETMVDVALATSAAPTYFPAHQLRGLRLVDGGLWANNPVLVGIAEAVSEFGIDLVDIRALSLGTTSDLSQRGTGLDSGGVIRWAKPLVQVGLRAQGLAAANMAYHLLPKGQFLRIDPAVPDKVLRLDGVSPEELRGRAEQESRHRSGDVKEIFLQHQAGPYSPAHTDKDDNDHGL